MHPAIIIGTVRSLIVDVAMGQIPRSTERISSLLICCIVWKWDGLEGVSRGLEGVSRPNYALCPLLV